MSSSQLLIARHGNRLDFVHPEWFDTAKRRYDPPLYSDGEIQAQQLADRLANEKIDYIVASPFLRTIQTAHIIAQTLDLSIQLEAGLSEWHNGEWMSESPQIHPLSELKPLYPRIDTSYRSKIVPQYPETEAQVLNRMKLTAHYLTSEFSGNLLLIGHQISVLGIAKGLLGKSNNQETIKTSLCSLTKLIQSDEEEWQLVLNGDVSHLDN